MSQQAKQRVVIVGCERELKRATFPVFLEVLLFRVADQRLKARGDRPLGPCNLKWVDVAGEPHLVLFEGEPRESIEGCEVVVNGLSDVSKEELVEAAAALYENAVKQLHTLVEKLRSLLKEVER